MKIISDFVTNSSEADYYDCDCDCNYKKKRYYNSSTNHMISKNTDCKSYKDSNIKFTSGDVSLFPVLTKTKIYSYMTHKYESQKDITYGKAKEYAEDDMIFDLKWNSDCTVFTAKSYGSGNQVYNCRLIFENKVLKGFKCSCPSYSKWHTLCKHLIGMMIVIEQKRKELKTKTTGNIYTKESHNDIAKVLEKQEELHKTTGISTNNTFTNSSNSINKDDREKRNVLRPRTTNNQQSRYTTNYKSNVSNTNNYNTTNNNSNNNQQKNNGLSDSAKGWIFFGVVLYLIVSIVLSVAGENALFGLLFGIPATIFVLILIRLFLYM